MVMLNTARPTMAWRGSNNCQILYISFFLIFCNDSGFPVLEPGSPHPDTRVRENCDCVEAQLSAHKCCVKLSGFVCS
jgi:hypothetical protein